MVYGCQVLGSTPLTALRDSIKCASDDVVTHDLSNTPDALPQRAKVKPSVISCMNLSTFWLKYEIKG